jgi:hypothetical protein
LSCRRGHCRRRSYCRAIRAAAKGEGSSQNRDILQGKMLSVAVGAECACGRDRQCPVAGKPHRESILDESMQDDLSSAARALRPRPRRSPSAARICSLPLRGREAGASIECSAHVANVGKEDKPKLAGEGRRRRHVAQLKAAAVVACSAARAPLLSYLQLPNTHRPWRRWRPEAAMRALASLIAVLASGLSAQIACELALPTSCRRSLRRLSAVALIGT